MPGETDDITPVLETLLKLMERHDLAELEVAREGISVRLKKKGADAPPSIIAMGGAQPAAIPASNGAATAPDTNATGEQIDPNLHIVTSPVVGSFYRAASPDADPYVDVADTVTKGQVICLIEAMKVFNEIKADVEGEVVSIFIENGEPVEYGQPLMTIRPA